MADLLHITVFMYTKVSQWLKKLKIPVSESYVRLRLESHPDYPSLLAIKDTLEELNIPSNAYETDKTHLQQTRKPFLVHLNVGEGQLLYFNSVEEAENKVKDFDKFWNGIVMLADKSEKAGNPDHDSYYQKENQETIFMYITAFLFLGLFIFISLWHYSLPVLLLFVSNIIGLYFSWLIAQKELGLGSSISDKICSLASHSRCEAVLFSKGAKLTKWLSWGDIGITWFVVSLLFLGLSQLTSRSLLFTLDFYYLLSLTALFFPLYSLYYQWKVVKHWCVLCIGVLLVLALNAFISIGFSSVTPVTGNLFFSAASFMILTALIFCGWQIIKQLAQKSTQSLVNKINFTRLKRNPDVLNGILAKRQINPINLPNQDDAISFGRPDAPVQIVMACNPYCRPCAVAHQAIEELYEKYPNKIATTIRFALHSLDESNYKTKAAISILKSVIENKSETHQIMKDWYSSMNYENFIQKYTPKGAEVTSILEQYKNWSFEANIAGTPTLFVNGKKLPELFNWKEFTEILDLELQI